MAVNIEDKVAWYKLVDECRLTIDIAKHINPANFTANTNEILVLNEQDHIILSNDLDLLQ